MVRTKKPVGKKVQRILSEIEMAITWEEKAVILSQNARKIKALVTNGNNQLDILVPLIIRILEANELDEFLFDRTLVRLDYTYAIPKDSPGIEKYNQVVALLGQDVAERLYIASVVDIPAHTETVFTLNQAELNNLNADEKRQLAKALRGKPKAFIGKPSQRARKGQSRHKTSRGS